MRSWKLAGVAGLAALLMAAPVAVAGARDDLTGGQAEDTAGHGVVDRQIECLEPAPAAIGAKGVTDSGQTIFLDAYVMLDGIRSAEGAAIMAKAAEAYRPLGITLRSTFARVSFGTSDAAGLIAAAKKKVGGTRPSGSDLVYVLTSNDITDQGEDGVAGLADCIGGVRFPDSAFAVGEARFPADSLGPLDLYVNVPAKIAGHEIGHLMGAHHHYANCVEAATTALSETAPCTLMFNFIDLQALRFSTANGAVVRGHAVSYAAP